MNQHASILPAKPIQATALSLQSRLLQRQCACGNSTVEGGECEKCAKKKSVLQRKIAIGASNDPLEREADQVAEQVLAAPAHSLVSRAPPRIQRFTGQVTEGRDTAPPIVDSVIASPGRPLEPALQHDMEQRFGCDFSRVRVHTDSAAEQSVRQVNAYAYTVGHNIAFGAGRFVPGTSEGRRLLAHELTHVVQQSGAGGIGAAQNNGKRDLSVISKLPGDELTHDIQQGRAPAGSAADTIRISGQASPLVQRSNPADTRLPRDEPEAIAFATAAKIQIDAANARLGASADLQRRNVPAFVAQQAITLTALTPRHDSAVAAPRINFFAGQIDYSVSVELPARASHHINAARDAVRIRARDSANVDNLLAGPEIEARLVQAVSEVAHTKAARQGAPDQFDLYRAQFNGFWNVAPFAVMSVRFDVTLSSKGPRTPKARAIFNQIYADTAAVKTAYDANTAGIRERIDAYVGPEGMNPINSPRLQNLRAAFFPVPAPVPNASYPPFRASVRAAATALEQADRDVVDASNDWQRLINQHVTTPVRRDEIREIIRTPPPPPPPAPVAAPAVAPAPAGGGAITPQMFVNGLRLGGPVAPVIATGRRQRVPITPRSNVANPNVAIDSRITVAPAARVQGNNVSPASRWPNGAVAGTAFAPEIINTSTVLMTAHLDMVNGPVGLAPAAPIPDLPFTVQDDRQTNFIANWFGAVNFNSGAGQEWFVLGTSHPRYRGGTQNFNVGGFLPPPATNPGLTLFVKTRVKRGAAVIAAPAALEPFPPDAGRTTVIPINLRAPAVVGVLGDNLSFEVELIAADRVTVLNTQIIAINIGPEAVYTRAQALAAAVADDAHFHDNTPAGLLGQMTAMGGAPASVAAAINAPAAAPRLTLRPLTVRHDSAAYVTAATGGPKPEQVGYFVGTTYNNAAPDAAHSFAGVAGAAAFFIPSGFGPRFVAANRTTDVPTLTQRPDAELIMLIVHEGVHAMDKRPSPESLIERYKTEFRAYWMDGRFGPADQGACPPPVPPICPPSGCRDTAYRPELPPPGPKSCRARAIFENVYGSTTYPFVKPAYDNNTAGFREAVDSYLIPDGINLIVSVRLESLRARIASFAGPFPAFRTQVQRFMGIGAAPAVGVLNADERNEIQRNRAWRDLVNSSIANPADRAQIKTDLGIPI